MKLMLLMLYSIGIVMFVWFAIVCQQILSLLTTIVTGIAFLIKTTTELIFEYSLQLRMDQGGVLLQALKTGNVGAQHDCWLGPESESWLGCGLRRLLSFRH